MATNKRKDSAALFELIDKSTLKVPKHSGGSLKIPSWWSSKNNPPSLSPPQGGAGGNGGARPPVESTAFQKPLPQTRPSASGASPQAAPQPRMFAPPPPDVSGSASPSIRPPVPPSGPRFAMVTAASNTGEAALAADQEAGAAEPAVATEEGECTTAVMETQEVGESGAAPDSRAAGSPESYAGLGAGRRVFAPQTMSQSDGVQRDWASLQKSRLARTPMWAMVAGVSAIVIFLALVVYTVVPHHVRATAEPTAHSGAGGATKLVGPEIGGSLLPRQGHPAPTVPPAADYHNVLKTTAPAATPGRVYEPGTVPRSADLYYIKIATTAVESIARRNADFLARHGVSVSIETQMSRTHHLLYILVSAQGFPTIGDAHELRKQIVDVGHMPPYFSSGHPAWDDAPVLKWSSLTGSRR